jgi:hypothetical protein
MPSHGLQTKTEIHSKHKWIIEISPKLQTINKIKNKKQITKTMWNEIHGKHNWNKDMFRVCLRRHLKEVVISLNPYSNFLQTIWIKNKTNIENWTMVLRIA